MAAEFPDKTAVTCNGVYLTYAQLNARANIAAQRLFALGVEPGELVAIALSRSAEQIVGILGILKAGCAYLPIDPEVPSERLTMMIDDANVSALVTDSSSIDRFAAYRLKTVTMAKEALLMGTSENPCVPTGPDDLAYVMFTSGSTGRPKGVMVEHRSVVRLVKDTDYADFAPDNVFLQFAPITFDATTFEIWGALLNGATLAIMPEGVTSLADLGLAIREYGVTTLWLTAGLFHLMVDERLDDLRPLRQLLAGGDVLSVTHVKKVLDNLRCDLINGYGPTENTTFTCTYKVPRDADLGKSIPIGKPISRTQVIILDDDLRPVADGDAGELYIGGDGLARGYLNSYEMTAERFIPNPFATMASPRLYRSGDLARVRPDGNIEFLGRADKQVKIRGFRVELDEIELALTSQDSVRDAAVVARDESATEKRLVAFVVTDLGCGADVSSMRKRLFQTLPEYMIPSAIIPIDELPLTNNGKVDRAALIALAGERSNKGSPRRGQDNGDERKIARILEDILGNGVVGTNENFFDLGANSLQIARFHDRLQKAFDPNLKIVSLFQNPTVSSLARSMNSRGASVRVKAALHDRASRQREAYARRRQLSNGGN
ncbi:MAG: non-ribosomal peptide synthetase [Pyrinomonadaceae bacterium]